MMHNILVALYGRSGAQFVDTTNQRFHTINSLIRCFSSFCQNLKAGNIIMIFYTFKFQAALCIFILITKSQNDIGYLINLSAIITVSITDCNCVHVLYSEHEAMCLDGTIVALYDGLQIAHKLEATLC